MRTKILAAFVAGGLLVGAGFLTSIVSAPGTARAQEDGADDGDGDGPVPRILGFLGEVLDDLVGDGTITQDQADAIVEAARDKADQLREEHMALREQVSQFLTDGVITAEEASELPDDHWLLSEAFDEAWQDGELSIDEIRQVRDPHRVHPFERGMRLGALLDDGGIDQEEYDSLGEDHPLSQIDVGEYLADGLITPDELREIFRDLVGSHPGDNA